MWLSNRQQIIAILVFSFASSAFAQVIFSRRVYMEHGASYQQLFTWNPSDGVLKQLTHSPRDHYEPECHNGAVQFTVSSLTGGTRKLWTLDLASGNEKIIGLAQESPAKPSSQSRGCALFAKNRELEACANDETLVVSHSGKQVARFQIQTNTCPLDNHGIIGKCNTPIRSLNWTEDGNWLLISEEGLEDNSTARQNDYYLFNLANRKLSMVASAENAFWLPNRDQLVYVTPKSLSPLPGLQSKHKVWVQHLMLFDPVTAKSVAITSGLSNNVDPAWLQDFGSR